MATRTPSRSASSANAPVGPGEAERRVAEAERGDLGGVGAGVEEQVAAGDADVEGARADVGGDVARAEVEELDPVAGVGGVQVARVAAAGVPGLPQHLRGGLGERALVGHGDSEHVLPDVSGNTVVSTELIGHVVHGVIRDVGTRRRAPAPSRA